MYLDNYCFFVVVFALKNKKFPKDVLEEKEEYL